MVNLSQRDQLYNEKLIVLYYSFIRLFPFTIVGRFLWIKLKCRVFKYLYERLKDNFEIRSLFNCFLLSFVISNHSVLWNRDPWFRSQQVFKLSFSEAT